MGFHLSCQWEAAEDLIQKTLQDIKESPIKKSINDQKKQLLAKSISKSIHFPKVESQEEAKALLLKLFKCENLNIHL